jgi:Spy/CpxP family protein refolding chaperone
MLRIYFRTVLKYSLLTGAIFIVLGSVGYEINAQPRGGAPGMGMHDRPEMGGGMGPGMGGGMGGGMGHGHCEDEADTTRMPPWLNRVELSADQRSEILTLHTAFCAETEDLRDRMVTDHAAMHDQFGSNASRADLERQHQDMAATMSDLHDRMFTMMLDIRDVLTPEQREQLGDMMGPGMMGNPDAMGDANADHDHSHGRGDHPVMHDPNGDHGGSPQHRQHVGDR